MNKVIKLLFLIIISPSLKGQNLGIDSLRKYSYLVGVYKDTEQCVYLQGITTGFFIKRKGYTFFLSSGHMFRQTNSGSNVDTGFALDVAAIRIFDLNNNATYAHIDLSKIPGRRIPFNFYTTPDFFPYLISANLDSFKINSIEGLLSFDNDLLNKVGATIKSISYGYFDTDLSKHINLDVYHDSLYQGEPTSPSDYENILSYAGIDNLNFVLKPKTFNGASGSPIFFIYATNKKKWVEFEGMTIASDSTYNFTAGVKKSVILEYLDNFIATLPPLPK